MNTLTLDTKDERFAALADCADGETKTVTVTGTVTRDASGGLSLAVDSVDYEAKEPEEEAVETPVAEKPAKGGPDHAAVMLLVKKPAKA